MSTIAPADLLGRIDQRTAPPVVDVRTPAEFAAGHVPGAVNVPLNDLMAGRADPGALAGRTIVVYCGRGPRAWMASVALRRRGVRDVVYLKGHWTTWQRTGLRIEKTGD